MSAFWHPFADMNAVTNNGELVLVRGQGSWVWDSAGKKYFDGGGALWYCNIGHGREAVAKAMYDQACKIASYSNFGDMATEPAVAAANLVASLAPVPDSRVFFTSGGSDAVDTALKMVRRFWTLKDQPQKKIVIVRENGYHGMHAGGTSLAGIPDNNKGYNELVTDVVKVPWDDSDELIRVIDSIGEDNIAAFYCEPVMGAGGALFAPEMYLQTARKACLERNILFVADEVITGFGRTGEWFASIRYDLQPDLMLVAKGLTSGYAPLGAVVAAPSVWKTFYAPETGVWRHGYTYSGHATATAAALANLKIMMDEDLPGHVRRLEKTFSDAVQTLSDIPAVDHVRSGVGFLAGIQLKEPLRAMEYNSRVREAGLLTRAIVGGAIQISPALSTTEDEIHQMVALYRAGLTD